jgi:hypothetical protein
LRNIEKRGVLISDKNTVQNGGSSDSKIERRPLSESFNVLMAILKDSVNRYVEIREKWDVEYRKLRNFNSQLVDSANLIVNNLRHKIDVVVGEPLRAIITEKSVIVELNKAITLFYREIHEAVYTVLGVNK